LYRFKYSVINEYLVSGIKNVSGIKGL